MKKFTLTVITTDVYSKEFIVEAENETEAKEMVKAEIPERGFDTVAFQASGNQKLGLNCSYCAFKKECWPDLRTFLYANTGPVYLTKVIKEPNVYEVKD